MEELIEIVKDIRTIVMIFGIAWCIVTTIDRIEPTKRLIYERSKKN